MNAIRLANPANPAYPIQRRAVCRWLAAPWVACAGLMVGTAALSQKTSAQDSPLQSNPTQPNRYRRTAPSADGIGKVYMGREIAGVMGWQGAAWLEREERQQEERGDLLLRELVLKPGMTVADVGAGTGYYARRMAPLVGTSGQVLAVDVQPEMIQMLTDLAKKSRAGQHQGRAGRGRQRQAG